MSNGENTKEKHIEERANQLAEELAAALEEVTDEEEIQEEATAKERVVEEAAEEETVTGETVPEEAVAKETVAEETVADETTLEGTPAEETAPEEAVTEETPRKKSKKTLFIVLGIIVAVLAMLAAAYFMISKHYSNRFFKGTTVNGVDCSENTIKDVEALLQKQVEEYALSIVKADGTTEQIKGTDIDIAYVGYNQLKEAFAEQNAYLWPKSFFENKDIKAEIVFDYNKEKLDAMIAGLGCMQAENQTAAVPATVVYKDGQFVIQEETYGSQVDAAKLNEELHKCVATMNSEFSLEEGGCYIQPTFKKDSAEVIAAKDAMNKYLEAKITYSLDSVVVTVDKETIAPWISVDVNMAPVISADAVKKFVGTLGSKYNTSDRSGILTTPTGKQVTISKAGYGRKVGTDAETKQLISEITAGKTVERAPVFSQSQTPEGQNIWGTTYIEVDITEQHMWYIVNGQIALETDIVTGKKGKNDTPTGTYAILEKDYKRVLRGRPLANGKPSYLTPVDYWMRVTWSGIGFHDANWQPTFGGDRYVTNGSHGCINMPPAMAKELFNMISLGTHVIIHH